MEKVSKTRTIFRTPSRVLRKKTDYISFEKFISLNLRGKETKYEWKSGKILKEFYIKRNERIIIDNIITKYIFSSKSINDKSKILAEADIFLKNVDTFRRPDAVYFTREQIIHPEVEPTIPYFIIEVNSSSNTFDGFESKLEDYFNAGVKTVWQIMPNTKKVYVYFSAIQVEIKSKSDICIAFLENGQTFEMSVEEIFKDFQN